MVICGWHGWRIRLEDGSCPGKTLAARTYPCEVREGRLWVEIPRLPEALRTET
jgi:nitrite reductase/ring-hydroxylating ferredoxin subunit